MGNTRLPLGEKEMKMEYEQPIIEVLIISDEKIMTSGEHDNSFGDFEDWEDDFDL